MRLDRPETDRIEAAFEAAQAKTHAPLVCVLARQSSAFDAEFMLGACVVALVAPWPLIVFTRMSAERIFVAQLLVAIVASVAAAIPAVRRWLTPSRAARAEVHRAALAQFALRGLERSGSGVLVYVSLAERCVRIVAAEESDRIVKREQWQTAIDAAIEPLRRDAIDAALTGLATRCGELLAPAFPPDSAHPQKHRKLHLV